MPTLDYASPQNLRPSRWMWVVLALALWQLAIPVEVRVLGDEQPLLAVPLEPLAGLAFYTVETTGVTRNMVNQSLWRLKFFVLFGAFGAPGLVAMPLAWRTARSIRRQPEQPGYELCRLAGYLAAGGLCLTAVLARNQT